MTIIANMSLLHWTLLHLLSFGHTEGGKLHELMKGLWREGWLEEYPDTRILLLELEHLKMVRVSIVTGVWSLLPLGEAMVKGEGVV